MSESRRSILTSGSRDACQSAINRRRVPTIRCVLSMIIVTVLVLLYYSYYSSRGLTQMLRPGLVRTDTPRFADDADVIKLNPVGRVIDTPSCVIPDFDPYNPVIAKTLKDPSLEDIACNTSWPMLTDVVDGHVICINVSLSLQLNISHCQFQEIRRTDDYEVKYGPAVKFTSDVQPEVDFVRVKCFQGARRIYTNFHALVKLKEDVERRSNKNMKEFMNARNRSADDIWNVLMIGVDSTSRLNSIRRLRTSRQFLHEKLEVVELKGYGRVGDNTYPNLMALLTGKFANERPFGSIDRTPLLWRQFADAGYRTLYVEDSFIENHIFNIWVDTLNSPRGFSGAPTDYYYRTMSVAQHGDKESEAISRWFHGPVCIGPTFETELILNWMRDFALKMKSDVIRRPFFEFGFFSRLTHEDHNSAAWIDFFLDRFFQRLYSEGVFTNTVIVLFSDHGVRYGPTRGYTRMGWYEENTPMALVALPPSFRRRHTAMVESLRSNSGSLTTPMDLHETVRRLLTVGQPFDELELTVSRRRGRSLFDGHLGDRSCEQASIAPVYCECMLSSTMALEVDSDEVNVIAELTVEQMNNILSAFNASCAIMHLVRVFNARVTHQVAAVTGRQSALYTLTFQTSPGNGIFQTAVMRFNNTDNGDLSFNNSSASVDVHGDILRLNSYSNSTGCLNHVIYKKWCHCV